VISRPFAGPKLKPANSSFGQSTFCNLPEGATLYDSEGDTLWPKSRILPKTPPT